MRSAVGTRENVKVINSFESGGMKVEVLEYQKLLGLTDTRVAQQMYFLQQQNIKVRQIAVYLNNDKVTVEKGAMSYFQGNLQMVSGITATNIVGKFISSKLTGETMVQPVYEGTGLLVLEPSFRHYIVLELDNNESIIVDNGMFYCAQGSVTVKTEIQKTISSALAGGEGLFQTKLTGPGLVVLESPVPECEIDEVDLVNDVLRVDGNFSLIRTASLKFTVERSAKTLIGSAVSGEGLVNVYTGTGKVWLAPTIKVYNTMSSAMNYGYYSTKSMDMNTSHS
jgi:uncharacterized protein (AIM24 family)